MPEKSGKGIKMKGYILVNIYGEKKLWTENRKDAEFALKVFGKDWHIEESEKPEFEIKEVAGLVMGYAI